MGIEPTRVAPLKLENKQFDAWRRTLDLLRSPLKQSFAACGRLTEICYQSIRSAGNAMINYNNYLYLRYVLLVNIIAALIPSMTVKGRVNDPLLHSTWWTTDQHSAVLVVSLGAILSSALVFLAARMGNRRWWIFVGCGIVAGDFPATFYLATVPDNVHVPLAEMYVDGTFCGVLAGAVLTSLLRSRTPSAAA